MRQIIVCEGPDDITALRELLILFYNAKPIRSNKTSPAAGENRRQELDVKGRQIELLTSPSGKSGLASKTAQLIEICPLVDWAVDLESIEWICVVFDPDEEDVNVYGSKLETAIKQEAPSWKVDRVNSNEWTAVRRPQEVVRIRAIAWRAPGPVIDNLFDNQNLDRLLCAIAAKAFPQEAPIVEKWLTELNRLGKRPGWKAALHLWCALVEEKASETNAAAKFLRQNPTCKQHVKQILDEVSLLRDLQSLLGPLA